MRIITKRQIGKHQDHRGLLLWASPKLLNFDYEYLTIGSIKPGCQRGGHYHKETLEQFMCIAGKITYARDNERIVLEAGEITDIPLETVHTFINEGRETAYFVEFKIKEHDPKDVFRKDN